MKYFGKLLLSLKEIILLLIIQYIILFLCFIIFGPNKTLIIGTIFIMIINIIYILLKYKYINFSFKGKNYLPYILIGIGISSIYNMIIFKIGIVSDNTSSIPILLNILCSGIIGPLFEEVLFRYDLIRRLSKFNSNKWIIIILASIIFAIFHTGIATIIYALIIGFINSYIYTKDKDITKPIMIHIAGNFFVNFLTGYNILILILGILLIFIGGLIIKNNN